MTDQLTEDIQPTFAERVVRRQAGNCDLYVLETPIDQVVSFAGSILTLPDYSAGEALVQELMVLLLDKGTKTRDRFAVADLIDNRGVQLNFRSSGNRIVFSGRALREDLADVLMLVAEQLREPLFDELEFEKARARLQSEIQRSMENTGALANAALARQLYEPAHPNYEYPPEAELALLESIDLPRVRSYHDAHIGANELTLVLVGDVAAADVEPVVARSFEGWKPTDVRPAFAVEGISRPSDRIVVPVPDKQNVDARLGHSLSMRRNSPDYLPLYVGNFILGGNFSSRLMSIVRDKLGLTYGIGAMLSGMSTDYDGYWRVAVTLSEANLERGIDAACAEVRRIAEQGVTPEELDAARTTITGSFQVDLATTGGLAFSILINVLRGFGVEYLDRFSALISGVSIDEVNQALRRHLQPDAMHLVMAGSL